MKKWIVFGVVGLAWTMIAAAALLMAQTYEKGKDGKIRQVFTDKERTDRLSMIEGRIQQHKDIIATFTADRETLRLAIIDHQAAMAIDEAEKANLIEAADAQVP